MAGEQVAYDPNPRKIPAGAKSFEANGKVYHKADSVSLERWRWLKKAQILVMYGKQPHELYGVFKQQKELINKLQFFDVAVITSNAMQSVADISDDRIDPAVQMTMLFWNYQGEDVGTMTAELMREKHADMLKSGIDYGFFFAQALSCIPDFLNAYKHASLLGSEGEQKLPSDASPKRSIDIPQTG